MKRKNLLNETQVRKFMKLANINGDLTSNFLTEAQHEPAEKKPMEEAAHDKDEVKEAAHDKDKVEEGYGVDEDLAEGAHEGDDMDLDADDDADLDMPPADDDMGLDDGDIELSEDDALELVDAIVDAIGEKTGLVFKTSKAGDDDLGTDDMAVDDIDLDPGDAELDDDMELMDEDEIVSETLRRVTHRLNAINEREKIVNEAMSRVIARYGRGE